MGRVVWFRRLSADEESEYDEITLLDGMGRVADVQATDLTGNGQFDIVASAHMPERTEVTGSGTGGGGGRGGEANEALLEGTFPPETLIWLEQVRPGEFVSRELGRSSRGHMAMTLGDFDGDGHVDIAAGHFGNDPSGHDSWLTIWWGGGSLEVAHFGK